MHAPVMKRLVTHFMSRQFAHWSPTLSTSFSIESQEVSRISQLRIARMSCFVHVGYQVEHEHQPFLPSLSIVLPSPSDEPIQVAIALRGSQRTSTRTIICTVLK
jgi:hypothetical protein